MNRLDRDVSGKWQGPLVWLQTAPTLRQWLVGLLVAIALFGYGGSFVVQGQVHSSAKTIIVAVSETMPPFVEEQKNGELGGYSIDLIQALATHADLEVSFEKSTFAALLPGVATQLYDAAISCIFISEEREQLVNFSDPYLTTGFVLVVRESSFITTTADLTAEMNVGILQGGKDDATLQQLVPAKRVPAETVSAALDQAAAGVTDGALVDEFGARTYIASHPEAQLRILAEMLTTEHCAIAVNKQETWLLSKLNQALADLKSDQSFDTLYTKWFTTRPQTQQPYVPPTPTPPSAVDVAPASANEPPVDTLQKLTGVYYLTLQPSATTGETPSEQRYQVLTLTADGLWLASEAIQANPNITDSYTVNQLQGVWRITGPNQLSATVVAFQPSAPIEGQEPLPAQLVRLDYTLEVQADGQVTGSYAQYYYALGEDPTAAPAQPAQPLPLSGHRLEASQ